MPHQLIGSTSERNALSSEVDRAFTESLNSNIRKEMELRYNDSLNTKAVDLQSSPIARVVTGSGLTDLHVYIAVRHPTLGTRRRRFCQDNTCNYVYDWVVSLALHPVYCNFYCLENNAIVKTWELVRSFQNTVINITKCESSIFFEPFYYANDECDWFLAAKENEKLQKKEQDEKVDGKCKCDLKPVFTGIVENRRPIDEDNADSIICHRGNESFWRVLFKRNL